MGFEDFENMPADEILRRIKKAKKKKAKAKAKAKKKKARKSLPEDKRK